MPVIDRIQGQLRSLTTFTRRQISLRHPECRAALSSSQPGTATADEQLSQAMRWMCVAQDATPDDGVARSYSLVYKPYFGGRGWVASYPETTGYIIPTFYDFAALTGQEEFADRAGRMAAWESKCQMASGAVQGGVVTQTATPAIFNTGQVLFGWLRAYQETGNELYLDSALRAGRFLVDNLSEDGCWYRGLSAYAGDGAMTYRTYNVRCAWALALLAEVCGDPTFSEAAARAGRFVVGQQLENGWYPSNCLYNPKIPYLHTIAYATRGLLETGLALKDDQILAGGRLAAMAILRQQGPDGSLSGRFDRDWTSVDEWSCLTGVAQIALCWGRLVESGDSDPGLAEGIRLASVHLRRCQLHAPAHPNVHGAIAGSYPLGGGYGAFELLNWAAKFYADLLMMESRLLKGSTTQASA